MSRRACCAHCRGASLSSTACFESERLSPEMGLAQPAHPTLRVLDGLPGPMTLRSDQWPKGHIDPGPGTVPYRVVVEPTLSIAYPVAR